MSRSIGYLVILGVSASFPAPLWAESNPTCFVRGEVKAGSSVEGIRLRFDANTLQQCQKAIQEHCRGWIKKGQAPQRLSAYFRPTLSARESQDFGLDGQCAITALAH